MLTKIDEILAWEKQKEAERDIRFVELGCYLCEVRAGQYWRVENVKSFDEFLARRFPESRRKAYYLMSIHEHLPPQARRELKEVGWTKGLELAKIARRDRQNFDCATWLHKAREMPKEQLKHEVEKELTGRDTEPAEIIYFKLYKSQIPVIEQAIETAALMLVLLCYKKGDPQKGQPESCRSRTRAMVCRRVAMDQGLCRSTRTGRTPRAELERHFRDG